MSSLSMAKKHQKVRLGLEGAWPQFWIQTILLFSGFLILVPFIYVISISLKTQGQLAVDPWEFVPSPLTFDNFLYLNFDQLLPMAANTLIIVTLSVVGQVLSCAIVAYPLARLHFRGRSFIFFVLIATIMLPPTTLMIPQYLLYGRLGWVDTFLPFIVPAYFGISAFNVFFLRQQFRSIPKELDESVFIDGGTHWTVFSRIVLPLSRPALIIVAILHIIGTYNDFFGPLIYLHSSRNYTLAIGILSISSRIPDLPNVPVRMAATLVMALPLVVFYLLIQRFITDGIDMGFRR